MRNTRADTSVTSLSGWLEKYGSPNRQPEPQVRRLEGGCSGARRDIVPRPIGRGGWWFIRVGSASRIPFLGLSEAKTLRLGAGQVHLVKLDGIVQASGNNGVRPT